MSGEWKVTVPEGESGNFAIKRFSVSEDEARLFNLRAALNGERRSIHPGTYTSLTENGRVWMSDTPAEMRDHAGFIRNASDMGGNILINGLGLGVVVGALLHAEKVERIDVVELSADVIALSGPHYEAMAREQGKQLAIHHADALTIPWPSGTMWTAAWHDIWPTICADNWETMKALHRKYARRVLVFQDSWCRERVKYEHSLDARR